MFPQKNSQNIDILAGITVAKKKRDKFLRLQKLKKMISDFNEILGQCCI